MPEPESGGRPNGEGGRPRLYWSAMLDDIYNKTILQFAGSIPRIGRLEAPDASATACRALPTAVWMRREWCPISSASRSRPSAGGMRRKQWQVASLGQPVKRPGYCMAFVHAAAENGQRPLGLEDAPQFGAVDNRLVPGVEAQDHVDRLVAEQRGLHG